MAKKENFNSLKLSNSENDELGNTLYVGQSIEDLYVQNRDEFILFANRFNLTKEDILDAYQDAILVYFQLSKNDSFSLKKSTAKSYLFSIGKHKLVDKIRDEVRARKIQEELKVEGEEKSEFDFQLEARQEKLKKALLVLGDSCREVLNLYYYQKYAIKTIRSMMDYKSDNVVKAHKSRCIKKLKALLKKEDGHNG